MIASRFLRIHAAAAIALGSIGIAQAAHARTDVFFTVGVPAPVYQPRVYEAPVRIYERDQPVYVAPEPVYVAQPQVYVRPGYDDSQWRREEWRRQEWRREQRREQWRAEHQWRREQWAREHWGHHRIDRDD